MVRVGTIQRKMRVCVDSKIDSGHGFGEFKGFLSL